MENREMKSFWVILSHLARLIGCIAFYEKEMEMRVSICPYLGNIDYVWVQIDLSV